MVYMKAVHYSEYRKKLLMDFEGKAEHEAIKEVFSLAIEIIQLRKEE